MVFIALISFLRYSCIACEPPTPLISQLHLPVLLFFLFSLLFFLLLSLSLSLCLSSIPFLQLLPHTTATPPPSRRVHVVTWLLCMDFRVARFCLHYLPAHTLQLPSRVPALPNISPRHRERQRMYYSAYVVDASFKHILSVYTHGTLRSVYYLCSLSVMTSGAQFLNLLWRGGIFFFFFFFLIYIYIYVYICLKRKIRFLIELFEKYAMKLKRNLEIMRFYRILLCKYRDIIFILIKLYRINIFVRNLLTFFFNNEIYSNYTKLYFFFLYLVII